MEIVDHLLFLCLPIESNLWCEVPGFESASSVSEFSALPSDSHASPECRLAVVVILFDCWSDDTHVFDILYIYL